MGAVVDSPTTWGTRLAKFCVAMAAALAMIAVGAVSAQALPTCESAYAPTSLSEASNAASAPTALTAAWKIPASVEKEVTEQQVYVWPAGEVREAGRRVLSKETSVRSFVFNNNGEKGEAADGSEPGFIEPSTTYDLAVIGVYGTSTKYPEGCSIETKSAASVATRHIIGLNGTLCCSAKPSEGLAKNAETLLEDGIASDRVSTNNNPETEAEETYGNTPKLAYEHHFVNNDVIVGNILDSERLSKVTTATWVKEAMGQIETAAKYGNVLMEVGNEMWLKGQCGECAEPAKYAEMFVALSKEVVKAKESKVIPQDVKLLFDLTGDYYLGHSEWSNATEKRGWLGDAVTAQPELKTRIEGFTFHPYDAAAETLAEEEKLYPYEYDWGVRGLKEDDAEAVELGVKHTNVYATEFGVCTYKLIEGECRKEGTKITEAESLKNAETDYNELLNSSEFPEVKGVWWYGAYPGEAQWYSFFKGWGGGEETELPKLASTLSLSSAPPNDLGALAVTDQFNSSATTVSNFSSNWSVLGWASEKGLNRSSGWGPSGAYPTVAGAYYAPTAGEVGSGVADVATMSEAPLNEGRYFSLWLDMSTPSSTRSGYQLTFTDVSSGTYEVKLSKWVSGTQTALASKSSYAFATGDSLALVARGGVVSAWVNTGSGFSELLRATDTTFYAGNAGVEGSGNITRLTKFKFGQLLGPVSGVIPALEALALNDTFAASESVLSDSGAFAALAWDNSTSGHNTGRVGGGWGPYDAYSTINGAYWQQSSFADTGSGVAVAAQLAKRPENESRYFALWADMPSPASARSGYELRFKETSSGVFEVVLAKWASGTETVLASKSGYSFAAGDLFALDDNNGTVSAWTKTGTEFTQLLSASDSTYTSGYTGIEGSGNIARLTSFKSGPLPPT
jgi:hypothetical protein